MSGALAIFVLFALFIAAYSGALWGSMSAIRKEWHDEPIWGRCIKPLSLPICMGSAFVLGFAGFFLNIKGGDYLTTQIGRDGALVRTLIFIAVTAATFVVTRVIVGVVGTLLYGDAVRRAGYK
jgi:hypothetical protein